MIKNTFKEKTFQDKEENFNDIDQKLVSGKDEITAKYKELR